MPKEHLVSGLARSALSLLSLLQAFYWPFPLHRLLLLVVLPRLGKLKVERRPKNTGHRLGRAWHNAFGAQKDESQVSSSSAKKR